MIRRLLDSLKKPKNIALMVLAVVGPVLFFISSEHFRKNLTSYSSLILFLFSLLVIFAFFFIFAKKEEERDYISVYKKEKWWIKLLKWLNAAILAAAGLYLDVKHIPIAPYILFLAAIVQIMVVTDIKEILVIINEADEFNSGKKRWSIVTFVLVSVCAVISLHYLSKFLIIPAFAAILSAAFFMGFFFNKNKFIETSTSMTRQDYYMLAVIIIVAGFFRFYRLDEIPVGFHYDARRTLDILMRIDNGGKLGVFLKEGDLNGASLPAYILYYFMKIFNLNMVGYRGFIALVNIATIPFLFLLAKELYDKRVAIFSSVFFALLFNVVIFSRLDNLVYPPVFLVVAGLYFFIAGVRKGKSGFLVAAGIITGLNLYTYHSGKMQPFIILFAFLIYGINIIKVKKTYKNIINLLSVGAAALVVFIPLLYFILNNSSAFMTRANLFSPNEGGRLLLYFVNNISDIIFSITAKGSEFPYVNLPLRPVLVGAEAFLFIVGFSYILYGVKKRNNMFLIIWIILALVPEVYYFHHAHPYYFRMILFFPVLTIVLGTGLNVVYKYFVSFFPKHKEKMFVVFVIAVVIFSGITTYKDYFNKYPENNLVRDEFEYTANQIENRLLGNKSSKEIISVYFKSVMYFFCSYCGINDSNYYDISNMGLNTFYNDKGKDVFMVTESFYADYIDIFKRYFPNAEIEKVVNPGLRKKWIDQYRPEYQFVTMHVPYEDIKGFFTMEKTKDHKGQNVWKGMIEIPAYKNIEISSDGNSAVFIDGKPAANKKYYKGVHELKVIADSDSDTHPVLFWQYEGISKTPVPAQYIMKPFGISGLIGIYNYNNSVVLKKLEPAIDFRHYLHKQRLPGMENFKVKWSGYYTVAQAGEYDFKMEVWETFSSSVVIDKKEVYSYINRNEFMNKIKLGEGRHRIDVIVQAASGMDYGKIFRLKVKTPGSSEFVTVRSSELLPE